jgi:hypothetical protein
MNRTQLFTLALVGSVAIMGISKRHTEMTARPTAASSAQQSHPYVGMWATADGHVRHNLLPNGRYDEARGNRESAYQGRYEVRGEDIFYWDDTGFTADGKFVDGVLYHGGMVLHRRR